jgi:formylglycine-generating enzyme required for sulfatase activity
MAAEQAKAEGLLGDFLFDEATQIAVQLRDEPHSRLSHLKDWGEEFLSEIEKSRQHQVRQTLETLVEASKHEEVHDYLSAIFALDSVPAAMRSTVLPGARETVSNALARVKKAQDEVRRLESLVKERLAAKSLDGLVVEVERLLLLQPDRSDVAKLRTQLLERKDRRDCAVASATGFLKAHDYEGALLVLSALPASYSTPQITNLQNQAATLVTHARGLMAQIRAAAAEKQFDGLLTTVDAYLRLKPADAEVLKLRQSLVARDEKIAAEFAEQLKQAKALEKACRFDEAAKMLTTLPENQKTDGIRESVKRYGILATARAKALQALMEASAGRYGEAIQATGGYAWQLISLGLVDAEFTETRVNILSWQAKEVRQHELRRTSLMTAGYIAAALILVSCGLWVRSSMRAASVANSLRESRWDDALAVDPENVTALVGRALGKLLASPPDIDGAFADIGRAEKLPDSSKNVEAVRGKAHAARAIDHVRHDRLAEASQDLAEAVRRNTDTYSSLAAARGAVAAAWLLRAKKAVAKRDNVLVENACYFADKAGAPADVVAAILTAVEAGRWDEAAEAVAPYARDLKQRQSVVFTNSIGISLKLLTAGSFTMGDSASGPDEKPHRVTLTKPFYMGVHEVTNAQWKQVMGSVPSYWQQADHPVEQVSWQEVTEFCRKLSALPAERKAGRVYRLPTEAEWEYACRAGTKTTYSFGDDEKLLGDYGWFDENSGRQTHPVGQKKPNAWGLYDMHGNVREWCSDWSGDYPGGAVTNPQASSPSWFRVYRGGSCSDAASHCRSTYRYWYYPLFRRSLLGFRLALSPSGVQPVPPEASTDQGTKTSAPAEDSPPTAVIASGSMPVSTAATVNLPETIGSTVGINLKLIPAGIFTMGESGGEPKYKPHRVTLTKPFYMGVHEVTNTQWKQVMGSVPSNWKEDDHPVQQVSWEEAVEFCRKLSALPEERKAGRGYRLPTEAEWEYAGRAGTTTKYSFGDDEKLLGDYSWFDGNSGNQTQSVGLKKPNALGLYDMHGNVWEWCSDWYGNYPDGEVTNPQGPSSGSYRVYRGGGWNDSAGRCRSAHRIWRNPSSRDFNLGFRLALSPSGAESPEAGTDQGIKISAPSEDSTPTAVIASGSMPVSTATAVNLPETIRSTVGINLKLIPAGTFMMGDASGGPDEKPPHRVTLTKPFYLGVHEVMNSQWKQVMGSVPSKRKEDAHPVEQVSWEDAVEFCRKLSELTEERKAGRVYRLPTEAEWEYACRAGTTTKYSFGDNETLFGDYGWFTDNSASQTYPVGLKKPNAWGLHDMHGNVWEWCSDWIAGYTDGEVMNPQGRSSGSRRVFRGGSWGSVAWGCRSATRDGY